MQTLNAELFRWIGAGHGAGGWDLTIAAMVAQYTVWIFLLVMMLAAWRQPLGRPRLLLALLGAGAASLAAHALAAHFNLPRPFVAGDSPAYIPHGSRGSMPSAHASVMFTVALLVCLHARLRRFGWVLLALALVTGWARVYVGVHYPLDIAGGLLLAGAVAAAALGIEAIVARLWPRYRRPWSLFRTTADPLANAGSAATRIRPRAPTAGAHR